MAKQMKCLDCEQTFFVDDKEVMTCYCPFCGSGHLLFHVVALKDGEARGVNVTQQKLF